MTVHGLHRTLFVLLLGFFLSLPTFVLADHLHESSHDEAACEICLSVSAAAAVDTPAGNQAQPGPGRVEPLPDLAPPAGFRIHRYQRGPPLLR